MKEEIYAEDTERRGEIVKKTVKCKKKGVSTKELCMRKTLNVWKMRMPEQSESL